MLLLYDLLLMYGLLPAGCYKDLLRYIHLYFIYLMDCVFCCLLITPYYT
jgi:hypothetical protein